MISLNAYNGVNEWYIIKILLASTSNKIINIRSVKEHVEDILKVWSKENRANLKKSK